MAGSSYVQQQINRKNQWVYFRRGRWIVHVCYWLLIVLMAGLQLQQPVTFGNFLTEFLAGNLLIAIFYYTYCLYLIPYLFKRNRMRAFWLWLIVLLASVPAINLVLSAATGAFAGSGKINFVYEYGKGVGIYLLNFIIFSILLLFMEMSENASTIQEAEQERRALEQTNLDLLKTRVSPAFVIQALRRLEEMTVDAAGNVPATIISFSDLLRYRLYRAKNHMVPLTEEIQALQSLIAFETRGAQPAIQLEQQGIAANDHIVPLTLVNLAELWFRDSTAPGGTLQLILLAEGGELTAELHYEGTITPQQEQELENYRGQLAVLYANKAIFDRDKNLQSHIISICLPLTSNTSAV